MTVANAAAITLTIDSRLDRVRLLCVAVNALCTLHMGADDAALMELAVAEAVTNVVEHGHGGRPGHPVTVTLHLDGDALVIRIVDRGRPIPCDALTAGQVMPIPNPAEPATLAEGGLGLPLIHAATDRVCYRSGRDGNVLELRRALPPPHRRA